MKRLLTQGVGEVRIMAELEKALDGRVSHVGAGIVEARVALSVLGRQLKHVLGFKVIQNRCIVIHRRLLSQRDVIFIFYHHVSA